MKKERKEDSFIKQPYYKGGDKMLNTFISENLKYPEISKNKRIEGDVHIRFDINHKGDVIDCKIIGGLDDACNDEALRVVKLLKYIVPKTPRHLKVTFHKNIRIHFNLNQPEIVPPTQEMLQPSVTNGMQMHYVIVKTPATTEPIQKPKPVITYSYVINGQ
jgi:TonB family protein